MIKGALLCLGCALSSLSVAAGEGNGWKQLRPGMSTAETAAALGRPLLRSAGKGFELWSYSGGAEVVFYRGPVLAWTPPTIPPAGVAPKPTSFSHDVFFLPGYRLPARGNSSGREGGTEGYSVREILRYRSRR